MTKTLSKFQSYLIVGPYTRKKTEELADQFGINLKKVSPDISIISPEKKSISIERIRELKETIYQKPIAQKYKLVIIQDAQKLTVAAQNSLLKIFEEPPSHALIILEAANKSALLPTIVSRAIVIRTVPKASTGQNESILISNKNTFHMLKSISETEDPNIWLDNQMNSLHQSLLTNIKTKKSPDSIKEIQESLEKCAEAKKMIDANVNPKFVLANLIFTLNSKV